MHGSHHLGLGEFSYPAFPSGPSQDADGLAAPISQKNILMD